MLHRLICFLIFTKNLIPDYTNLYSPYITPTDKILNNVHSQYLNEYFNKILLNGENEKLVFVTAVAYDSCNKYADKTINGTSEFFKNKVDGVETYVSKMISKSEPNISLPYIAPLFDIVELHQGQNIPHEEELLEYYNYDKCIVYNYNKDKCTIKVV